MEFIDRVKEQKRLRRALNGDKPSFIVIYGRRRMGKSALIKHVIGESDVYYEAEQNEAQVQIDLLTRTISTLYPAIKDARFDSWESVLTAFNELCTDRVTLVLDEFPYLVKKTPSLPSTLQRLIDSGELRYNLIICGSSQRMMQKIILGPAEPLYGRANEKILLGPIAPIHWKDAMHLDSVQTITEFSVWGGVPRYWVLREEYDDLEEAMEELIFDEHGVLANEPAALFLDEINDLAPYSSIMTAIANGHCRFSDLASAIGMKTNEMSTPLTNLAEMFYIRKEVPFGENEKKSKKTIYSFNDPFMAFYYKFVAPNKSLLALGRTTLVLNQVKKEFHELTSRVWEKLCQGAVSGNEIGGIVWGPAKRWWGKIPIFEEGKKTPVNFLETEFDVVAESLDGKHILVGECKWQSADYAERVLHKLQEKTSNAPFVGDRKVVYALFLKEKPLDTPSCLVLYPDDIIGM